TRPDQYPLLLHFPYFDLYRKQVVKQADLVLALHWRGDAFTDEEKAADLAYAYFGEAALMDLHDIEHNTRDGVHIAALAGAWLAAVAGFGGMRDHDGNLTFAPRLPPRLERLTFRILFRGRRLKVELDRNAATYTLLG